jgi:hypothetical protein
VPRESWTQIRYYLDPHTNLSHIHGHDVTEAEVEDVLAEPIQDIRGRDDSRIAIGQTSAGRYLKVIDVPDPVPGVCFVITAYELGPKAKKAIRRRRKKKK